MSDAAGHATLSFEGAIEPNGNLAESYASLTQVGGAVVIMASGVSLLLRFERTQSELKAFC